MIRILRLCLYGTRLYIALHYMFPTAFGIFLGSYIFNKPINLLQSIILSLAIFFSFQTSIILNDINDIKADNLLKRKTPLNSGLITLKEYQQLGIFFFVIALILSITISYRILLIVLLGNILHFLYSSPPFRLKRFYPLSILMLALGALCAAIAGYALYEPARPFLSFPLKASIFIVVPLFLALNFRDLADYEGDKKTDVQTLFTIFGLKKGRIINAVLIFLSYVSVPVILQFPLLFIATVSLGFFSAYYCLRIPFNERYIFYFYFVLIIILTILFNLKPEVVVPL